MKNGNVRNVDMINVFGTLADIDIVFDVTNRNGCSQDVIEDIIQEKYDDWMSDDDVTLPLAEYITSSLEIENGIILKAYM